MGTPMLRRFGFGKRERRGLVVVAGIVALTVAVITDAPILARVVAGAVIGTASGVVYVLVTIGLKKYGPDFY